MNLWVMSAVWPCSTLSGIDRKRVAGLSRRAACWRCHPSSIASNDAGSGRSGVASSTSTSAADPAALPVPGTAPPVQAPEATDRSPQCNTSGRHIMAANATSAMNQQVSRVLRLSPPGVHEHGPLSCSAARTPFTQSCRMMHRMQLRSFWPGCPGYAAAGAGVRRARRRHGRRGRRCGR